jgi:RND family efflux transporter MFP subunit
MNDSSQLLNELRIDRRQTAPPSRSPWPWILALVVLGVAGGVAWFAFGRAPVIEVRTTAAAAVANAADGAASAASVLDASGYVTARRQATVSSKITGKVIEVLIEEGMRVEDGQVLARLDPVDAQAQRALSNSQLAASRSQLDEARTQLVLAEKTLVRQKDLLARKLVAQSLFDQAQTERDALAARVVSAQRNVQVAQDGLSLSDISVDNTVVRAPFAGVVTVKAAQPGEMISPISAGGGFTRSGIATIVDMDSLEVQVDVNEAFIGRVRPKQQVEAVLNAYPDWRIPAEVIAIVPTADRGKATVKVRIALKAKDERIVPEMGVRVSFLEEAQAQTAGAPPKPPAVRVPADAIVSRDGTQVAFVAVDGLAQMRAVTVARSVGTEREVSQGLRAGDQVVLSPPAELKQGDQLKIANASQ